jgi:hypothetical protein
MGENRQSPPPVDHDPHVEVAMSGAKVTCSCGWTSHPGEVETSTTKRSDAMAWWYRHYVQTQYAASQ